QYANVTAMTTTAPSASPAAIDESSPRYAGWRVVAACYLAALCCWGFGLYGHGVYLTELNRLFGWPTAFISAGITGFYLATAALVVFINALWQLYPVYLLMAVGAATMHVGAISTVVGLWFDKKRPLAISLA